MRSQLWEEDPAEYVRKQVHSMADAQGMGAKLPKGSPLGQYIRSALAFLCMTAEEHAARTQHLMPAAKPVLDKSMTPKAVDTPPFVRRRSHYARCWPRWRACRGRT
mgnify:CR=1 FL=1